MNYRSKIAERGVLFLQHQKFLNKFQRFALRYRICSIGMTRQFSCSVTAFAPNSNPTLATESPFSVSLGQERLQLPNYLGSTQWFHLLANLLQPLDMVHFDLPATGARRCWCSCWLWCCSDLWYCGRYHWRRSVSAGAENLESHRSSSGYMLQSDSE